MAGVLTFCLEDRREHRAWRGLEAGRGTCFIPVGDGVEGSVPPGQGVWKRGQSLQFKQKSWERGES